MSNKVSTSLYIDRGVLETAKSVGLNISKVSENALIQAISLLQGTKSGNSLGSRPLVLAEGRGRDLNPGARDNDSVILVREVAPAALPPTIRGFSEQCTFFVLFLVSFRLLSQPSAPFLNE